MPRERERSTIPLPQILNNRGLSYSPAMCNHHFHSYPPLYIPFIIENYPEVACSSPIYLEKLVRPLEPPLRINRGTRAQFSFDHELPLPELIYFTAIFFRVSYRDGRPIFWGWLSKLRLRLRTTSASTLFSSTTRALSITHNHAPPSIARSNLDPVNAAPTLKSSMTSWKLSLGGVEGVKRAGIAHGATREKWGVKASPTGGGCQRGLFV